MAALVPIAWGIVCLALITETRSVREAALIAFTAVVALSVFTVELLSLFNAVTPLMMTVLWVLVVAGSLAVLRRRVVRGMRTLQATRLAFTPLDWLAGGVVTLFLAGTLASALLYPTTNYDSLTYHMPRVFFWFQNHSVHFYPTPEGRQLFSSTLVEYVALMLKTLSAGSDRLVNLVQWSSFAFAIVAASLIARELGAGRRGQQVAAIVVAIMPMALLQASTTQTDLTCAMWSLVVVFCVVSYVGQPVPGPRTAASWAVLTGAAFALAALAKAPAFLYCAPFLLWLAIATIRREGVGRALALAALLLGSFVLLGAGTYVRNGVALGGDILALHAPMNSQTLIQDRGPTSLITNALINGTMQLGTPSTSVNQAIAANVIRLVNSIGGDVTANGVADWGTFALPRYVTNHDFATAPLYVLLVVLSVLTIPWQLRGSPRTRITVALVYLGCALVAAVVSASLLTWNPWVNRVLLGAALLWAPVVGLAFSLAIANGRRLVLAALIVVLAGSLAWGFLALVFNTTNPLAPIAVLPGRSAVREDGYWNKSYRDLVFASTSPQLNDAFNKIASAAAAEHIDSLGLDVRVQDFPIYPLLAVLKDRKVVYVGKTLEPSEQPQTTDAVVTIMTTREYEGTHLSSAQRANALLPALVAGDNVVLMDRTPHGDAK